MQREQPQKRQKEKKKKKKDRTSSLMWPWKRRSRGRSRMLIPWFWGDPVPGVAVRESHRGSTKQGGWPFSRTVESGLSPSFTNFANLITQFLSVQLGRGKRLSATGLQWFLQAAILVEEKIGKIKLRDPIVVQWVKNWTSIHEGAGSIPGLHPWVKDLVLPWVAVKVVDVAWILCCCGCGVGRQLHLRFDP